MRLPRALRPWNYTGPIHKWTQIQAAGELTRSAFCDMVTVWSMMQLRPIQAHASILQHAVHYRQPIEGPIVQLDLTAEIGSDFSARHYKRYEYLNSPAVGFFAISLSAWTIDANGCNNLNEETKKNRRVRSRENRSDFHVYIGTIS